jgi:hypothetical protein
LADAAAVIECARLSDTYAVVAALLRIDRKA